MIETGRFKAWAVLEVMGHRKIAGLVTEVEFAGATMLRIEVPSDPPVVQLYGGKSIFAITEETEERCRGYAARHRPEVISRYELPATTEREQPVDAEEVEDDDPVGAEIDGDDDEWDATGADGVHCEHCGDVIEEGDEVLERTLIEPPGPATVCADCAAEIDGAYAEPSCGGCVGEPGTKCAAHDLLIEEHRS